MSELSDHAKRWGPWCPTCHEAYPCKAVREAMPEFFDDYYEI